jgi:hypothetical protein
MSQHQRLVLFTSFALILISSPSLLMAQHGPAGMTVPHATGMAGSQAPHASGHVATSPHSTLSHPVSSGAHTQVAGRSAGTRPLRASTPHPSTIYRSNTVFSPSSSFNNSPVPGLGFDFVHFAAVHPNLARRNFKGFGIVPFNGGYFFPMSGFGYSDSGTSDNQSASVNPDEQAIRSSDSVAPEAPADQQPPVSYVRSVPPVPPSSEYIFVRRDGSVFFAVAYSWVNGNLQYVTRDGLRKLASTSTLDLDATTQFNEQRGVPFHSPA